MVSKLVNSAFFKRSFSTIIIRGLGVILSFTMLLLITNLFPDEVVGKYQYFNSILIVGGTIALLGLNVSIIRFSGEIIATGATHKLKTLYIRNVFILITTTLVLIGLYFALRWLLVPKYISAESDEIFKWALITIFPNCLAILNFQAILGFKRLFLSETFRNIIKFSVIIVVISIYYFLQKYYALIEAFTVALSLLAIFSTIAVVYVLNKGVVKEINHKIASSNISYKKILQVSVPMTLSFISLLLMQQMDLLVLERYTMYENLAYYGIAVKISMILSIVLTAINQVIGPQIAELYYKNDKVELKKVIEKSILLNNAFVLPFILIIYLLPKTILGFFGENYTEASTALLILVGGQIINAFAGSTDLYMNMTGKQTYFQRIIFAALIINLALNFLLIPRYGMIGAAIATSVSLIFWNVLGVIYVKKTDGIMLILNWNLIRKYIR